MTNEALMPTCRQKNISDSEIEIIPYHKKAKAFLKCTVETLPQSDIPHPATI